MNYGALSVFMVKKIGRPVEEKGFPGKMDRTLHFDLPNALEKAPGGAERQLIQSMANLARKFPAGPTMKAGTSGPDFLTESGLMNKEAQERRLRCLIVDDDLEVGELLAELVDRDYLETEILTDGGRAVEVMNQRPADVVITDLMMGEVGGLAVLRHARKINPDVVVIIITGHGSLESAIEAIREGAYDYIRKPFKLQEMEICFNNAVDKIRLMQENRALLWKLKKAYDELLKIKEGAVFAGGGPAESDWNPAGPGAENGMPENQADPFQRVQALFRWRQQGLLSENEFSTLKNALIKGLNTQA